MRRHLGKLVALALVAAAVLGIRALVSHTSQLPDEPQPIAWDREPCAQCRMHIGEPAFAAQLITKDGQVLSFDDPGCMLVFLHESAPRVHRAWVRHVEDDRWLALDAAGFVRVEQSPMGYRLAAVNGGTPGSIGWAAAQARVLEAHEHMRGGMR